MNSEISVSKKAAYEAAELSLHFLKNSSKYQRSKDDNTPVTIADLGAQAIILLNIKKHFPDDGIFAEESSSSLESFKSTMEIGELLKYLKKKKEYQNIEYFELQKSIDGVPRSGSGRWWAIDPIDGTRGFISSGQYAICISLLDEKREPLIGVIACPNMKDGILVWAEKANGAWFSSLNRYETDEPKRIYASKDFDMKDLKLCMSVRSEKSALRKIQLLCENLKINRKYQLDSQCKYVYVAMGLANVYLRYTTDDYKEKIWDHAPGWLILKESGGVVTDHRGAEIDFTTGQSLSKNHGGILAACSKEVHIYFLNHIKKLGEIKAEYYQ